MVEYSMYDKQYIYIYIELGYNLPNIINKVYFIYLFVILI